MSATESEFSQANSNALTRKLELFGKLPQEDKAFLDEVVGKSRDLPARHVIIREGNASDSVRLVLEGFVVRSKTLQDGERQIFAYMLPGDFCDLHVFVLKAMDHDIDTIIPSKIVDIPRTMILEMTKRPMLARALWWATMVDEANLREWLVNLGQRNAKQRIAHLFCEIHIRLKAIGHAGDGAFEFPLTQAEIGATMGLSTVHVNRSLRSLEEIGLVQYDRKKVVIKDVEAIERSCGFNPNYFHLTGGNYDKSVHEVG